MNPAITNLAYLIASVLFIFGLKGLTHPGTAVRGNLLGALGMLLAVVVTLMDRQILDYTWIITGLIVGSVIGTWLALAIQMTAMPQMVALLNGLGGGASILVAGAAFMETENPTLLMSVATVASGIIGSVTFSGSLVAFAKLQEIMFKKPVYYSGQQMVNALLALVILVMGIYFCIYPDLITLYWLLTLLSLILGVLLVIPIGGADMPVVISLLNSYSGLAAAATGFVIINNVLIISGSLVGASGIILTQIMCRAMNRSLTNVLFGVMGPAEGTASEDDIYAGKVKSTSAEEVAMLLESARRVVFVPGYGLAVSQAQHSVRDLTNLMEARGTEVEFAIHPVAGRMPGHMNVLLAEADIPYDKLREMDEINPTFQQTDVAIVIGANDVVNPVARTDPKSPIAGMPILNVDQARTVIVVKRSLSPGFAGIPNPLFAADNALMYFADGKKALLEMIAAYKEI
ncbi:MAG: NAD(P)(+) transhydrogenase (Re/Si-specific) subunit beta [bacterium]|jgi:NAD(P) transhydrogenase subunit beta